MGKDIELPEDEEPEFDIQVAPEEDEEPAESGKGQDGAEHEVEAGDADAEYGERVKKRIAKETAKVYAERRQREQIQRERDEAIRAIQILQSRLQEEHNRASQFEQGFVYQSKGRAESQIDVAKAEYQRAIENGDPVAQAEAIRKITAAQAEKQQYEGYVPRQVVQPQQLATPVAPVQTPPQATTEELGRLAKFMRENTWFNKEPDMTERAVQLHNQILSQMPQVVGSDQYYDFIESTIKSEFPGKTVSVQAAQAKPHQGVAPVNRDTGNKSRKTVTLTPTQMKLARSLGITPEQYAAQLLKEQANG